MKPSQRPFPVGGRSARRFCVALGAGVVLGLAARVAAAAEGVPAETFSLREVSVFQDTNKSSFLRGQICRCQDQPFTEVKRYPVFVSHAPRFGVAKFGGANADTNTPVVFYFAVDESRGTGKGYDRLYFDGNRNLDLGDDAALKVLAVPPDHGYQPNFSGIKSVKCFEFLNLELAAGGTNPAPVEVMPRLLLTGDEKSSYSFLFFVRTHRYEGDIKIAGRKFRAILGNDSVITPDLTSPRAVLDLSGPEGSFSWWGGDRLSAMHKLDGRFYGFSASPTGVLTVQPYAGALGTFEAGPGARSLTNFTVTGSLENRDRAVAVGGDIKDGRPLPAARCELPAGDYLPEYLTVQYGPLRLELSQNYHSEGKRQSREGRPAVYGIAIRKERPCVLDFADRPEVMFTSPVAGQRLKRGDELSVAAVLVDSRLDIMIRRLYDTSRKSGTGQDTALDPTVIITRTNGEKVAEGVMPFG